MKQDIILNKPELDFRKYLMKWYYYVLSLCLMILLTKLFIDNRSVSFQASARILIKPNNTNSAKLDVADDAAGSLNGISKPNLDNEIEMLKSTKLIEAVINKIGYNTIIKQKTLFGEKEVYQDLLFNNIKFKSVKDSSVFFTFLLVNDGNEGLDIEYNKKKTHIPNNSLFNTDKFSIKLNIDKAFSKKQLLICWVPTPIVAKNILYGMSAKAISDNASVIGVSLLDNIEQRDTLLLNAIIAEYQKQNLNLKNRNLENSISFLNDRISDIKDDLGKIETEIKEYKVNNKIFNIKGQSTSDEEASVVDRNKLEQLKLKEMICNQILDYTNNPSKKYSLIPSSLGVEDATLLEIIKLYNTNALLREDLLKDAEPKNSNVKLVEGRLNSLIIKIKENLENIKKSINLSVKQTEKEYLAIQNNLSSLPEIEKELASIERLQAIKEKLYLYLLQKKEELSLSLAGSESNSYIIQTASIENRLGASENTIWSASILIAFMLPTLIIYLFHSLYANILTKFDVESVLDVPVIGEISRTQNNKYFAVNGIDRDNINEDFRLLRSNVLFELKQKNAKSILITSTTPNEGKSFVSINLGMALALTNKKVLLVEMDLRKPKLSQILKISEKEKGIVYYLNNEKVDIKEIIHPIEIQPNLYIIPCGLIPPNPSELLLSEKLKTLFDELNKQFDYIIIDTPPIGIISDAKAIAGYAGIGLYIVRQRFTSKKVLPQIDKLVSNGSFNNLSVVINDISHNGNYDYNLYKYAKYSYQYTNDAPKGVNGFFSRFLSWRK
ncbi:polysaccharide biosynthesis tyrosine autokinase [Parasediminibacterium sp. JCM 36343]|uniref:polysaccharide biosynthesis tyrosine autokinase n=1 Tax=Parasediminibacterium sp. JCM 36343 TaxID=3374279 RepID=UPI00397A5CB7